MNRKITIQGYEGSFHHIAAESVYGSGVQVIPCATFRELVRVTAQSEDIDGAIMAIENSIAGSILPNYSLLQNSRLVVTGEVYLQIAQNLLALPGASLEDIEEVESHPMAILQCADYLDQRKWRIVETDDTALSARNVSERGDKRIAAIASTLAAKMYRLNVLEPAIQTEKANYTRFLVLEKEGASAHQRSADKASVFFEVAHYSGSLAKVLTILASHHINLSKLQSVALPKEPWHYAFHADLEFNDLTAFQRAIDAIREHTEELNIYGIYQKGQKGL